MGTISGTFNFANHSQIFNVDDVEEASCKILCQFVHKCYRQ